MSIEWLGLFAGALTTFGLLPQIIRIFKLKSAHEISLLWSLTFLVGVSCWLAYGVCLHSIPLILWNAIASLFALTLIYAKLKYGR
jgi:MtN3 and saliva related transmembrane protein